MKNNRVTAERIRARREALDLSQDDLAELLGYSGKTAISKIERGVNGVSSKRIRAFASALRTSVAYLAGEVDDPAPGIWETPLRDDPLVLTEEEKAIIARLRMLDADDREKVLQVLEIAVSAFERSIIEEGSDDAGL